MAPTKSVKQNSRDSSRGLCICKKPDNMHIVARLLNVYTLTICKLTMYANNKVVAATTYKCGIHVSKTTCLSSEPQAVLQVQHGVIVTPVVGIRCTGVIVTRN